MKLSYQAPVVLPPRDGEVRERAGSRLVTAFIRMSMPWETPPDGYCGGLIPPDVRGTISSSLRSGEIQKWEFADSCKPLIATNADTIKGIIDRLSLRQNLINDPQTPLTDGERRWLFESPDLISEATGIPEETTVEFTSGDPVLKISEIPFRNLSAYLLNLHKEISRYDGAIERVRYSHTDYLTAHDFNCRARRTHAHGWRPFAQEIINDRGRNATIDGRPFAWKPPHRLN